MINARTSFILMLGERGAFLLPPAHLKNACAVFAPTGDKAETQALLDELAAAPRASVLLLYDGDDQHIRPEVLPPLSFLDRRTLIARRLEAAFPVALLRGSLTHTDKKGATLIAVRDGKTLAPWLERLAQRATFSQSVCLPAIESLGMIPRLAPAAAKGWTCLLTRTRVSGTRATVTRDGALILSRLLPPVPKNATPAQTASALAAEMKALRDYLARLGLMPEMPLTLIALLAPALQDALAAAPMDNVARVLLCPHEAARRLSLRAAPAPEEENTDALHALFAASRTRLRLPLMTPPARVLYLSELARKAGITLAALLFGLGLFLLASDGAALLRKAARLPEINASISDLKREYKDSQITLAPEMEVQRKATERRRLFQSEPPALLALTRQLAPTLQDRARLTALAFQDNRLRITLRLLNEPAEGQADSLAESQIKEDFSALAQDLQKALPDKRVSLEAADPKARTAALMIEDGGRE